MRKFLIMLPFLAVLAVSACTATNNLSATNTGSATGNSTPSPKAVYTPQSKSELDKFCSTFPIKDYQKLTLAVYDTKIAPNPKDVVLCEFDQNTKTVYGLKLLDSINKPDPERPTDPQTKRQELSVDFPLSKLAEQSAMEFPSTTLYVINRATQEVFQSRAVGYASNEPLVTTR